MYRKSEILLIILIGESTYFFNTCVMNKRPIYFETEGVYDFKLNMVKRKLV